MVNELILQEIEVFSDVFSMMIANIEFQSTYKVWKPPHLHLWSFCERTGIVLSRDTSHCAKRWRWKFCVP